jgi:excinuclease ABC subunit B
LLDPKIDIRPSKNQIDDLLEEIHLRIERQERVLVTTISKRMAEELSEYFLKLDIKTTYIHSDVDTLDRIRIMDDLRSGVYDVLVGVNLLREGLDLPEVSLVAIIDADKEGFLRSYRSLTQTIGRVARNVNGLAILYADEMTGSMQKTIEETERRREKQIRYNMEHNITPTQIKKARTMTNLLEIQKEIGDKRAYVEIEAPSLKVADPIIESMSTKQLKKAIETTRSRMQEAARKLDFTLAAQLRDEMLRMMNLLEEKE